MRTDLNLNGKWQFQIDRTEEGERQRWFEQGLSEAIEVNVPHIWQTEEQYVDYCGTAWYEKQFDFFGTLEQKQAIILFEAVDFQARVWLNGVAVGSHEGGFTPFELDITTALKQGQNRLIVSVYDPQDNAEIPIGKQGSWYTRVSGIWQAVSLQVRSATSVKHIQVVPFIDVPRIDTTIQLQGLTTTTYKATYTVTEHEHLEEIITKGELTITNGLSTVSINLPDAKLWSPTDPQLYDIHVTLLDGEGNRLDDYSSYFGLREVKFEHGQLLLNNKPLFIRAALDQAFYPDTIFTAPSDEWIIKEIELAKQMGFNLLRKHIKIEIPRYLYFADKLGLLIWAEAPNVIKWSAQSRTRFYNELVAMIERDYNRPSIIIWSLYNEEWGLEWDLANDTHKQAYVKEMYDRVKAIDPTRLICDNSGWIHVKTDINDYHRYFTVPEQIEEWKQDLDDYIINQPNQNYVEGYQSNGEPIIISEFGMWGLPSVKAILEHYGAEPSWFANLGDDTHREDFKMPKNAFNKFETYQLDRIFGDFEELATHSQHRMYRGVKAIIEEMRKREAINGYVVTEFTDIEWETNGWLDYTRQIKAGFEYASDFNGALVIMVDQENRNMWSEQVQNWDIIISNHDLVLLNGTIEWEVEGTTLQGEVQINTNNPFIKLPQAISFTSPNVQGVKPYKLHLRLVQDNRILAKNVYELTVTGKRPNQYEGLAVFPYMLEESFALTLKENGFHVVNTIEEATVIITSHLNETVLNYYRNGGQVIFLAEEGDLLEEKAHFTFRQLYQGESWDRASSFNYVDTSYFPELPLNPMLGWEMEGLFPDYIIPFVNYNKLGGTIGRIVYMFGNEGITHKSEIISGYFQGWLGLAGGSMLIQKSEKGQLTLTTWKLKSQYGHHPIATAIINNLLQKSSVLCSTR